ncbi:MAG: 2-oxoacid:acceptor oxidoreductase subunit alpha [Thermoplasmatota archaeon]
MKYRYDYQRLRRIIGSKIQFVQGDTACVYGSLLAGCSFFSGYPITPATEIAEDMSKLLPRAGGIYMQMEDEIASLSSVIGAVWAGAKAMTATSGPGFSLMMENIGYACMTETPCVIVDVQRSGPSTGQATKPAQGDVMQSRWGTHGDHNIIVVSPSTVQECFELSIESFNLAERYRTPVILLMDGELAQLREKLTIPDQNVISIQKRNIGQSTDHMFGGSSVPPMVEFGMKKAVHVTGSTHIENGMRDIETQKTHAALINHLNNKIVNNRAAICKTEEYFLQDATEIIISYGSSARPAYGAMLRQRKKGRNFGFIRLITLWPFPQELISNLGANIKRIFVPEMNLGQLSREIERFVNASVISVPKIGGIPHSIDDITSAIEEEEQ